MIRFLQWTAAGFLAAAAPANAEQPAATDDVVEFVRAVAPATAQARTGGEVPANKAIVISRRPDGELAVTGLYALTADQWFDPPERALAVMRTRAAPASGPDPADLDHARRTGVRIFIVGEWADPPLIWEIAGRDGSIRFRSIDLDGGSGPWQSP